MTSPTPHEIAGKLPHLTEISVAIADLEDAEQRLKAASLYVSAGRVRDAGNVLRAIRTALEEQTRP